MHIGDFVEHIDENVSFIHVVSCNLYLITTINLIILLQDDFSVSQLLMCYRSPSEGDRCLVRSYTPTPWKLPDGTPITNELDCPLLERDDNLFSMPPHWVSRAVSVVHECTSTCVFRETEQSQTVERECVKVNKLVFQHDWSNPHYCLNIFCIS